MARKGAKVLHLPCVQYAWKHAVPLRVLSTFEVNQGSLIKGSAATHAVCGIALQRDMALIRVESESFPSIIKQCQMLGIEVCTTIDEPTHSAFVIKRDAYAKLQLVGADKIVVQSREPYHQGRYTSRGISCHARQTLAQHGIDVRYVSASEQSSMLMLDPANVDRAANILHETYVTSEIPQEFGLKQTFLG